MGRRNSETAAQYRIARLGGSRDPVANNQIEGNDAGTGCGNWLPVSACLQASREAFQFLTTMRKGSQLIRQSWQEGNYLIA